MDKVPESHAHESELQFRRNCQMHSVILLGRSIALLIPVPAFSPRPTDARWWQSGKRPPPGKRGKGAAEEPADSVNAGRLKKSRGARSESVRLKSELAF